MGLCKSCLKRTGITGPVDPKAEALAKYLVRGGDAAAVAAKVKGGTAAAIINDLPEAVKDAIAEGGRGDVIFKNTQQLFVDGEGGQCPQNIGEYLAEDDHLKGALNGMKKTSSFKMAKFGAKKDRHGSDVEDDVVDKASGMDHKSQATSCISQINADTGGSGGGGAKGGKKGEKEPPPEAPSNFGKRSSARAGYVVPLRRRWGGVSGRVCRLVDVSGSEGVASGVVEEDILGGAAPWQYLRDLFLICISSAGRDHDGARGLCNVENEPQSNGTTRTTQSGGEGASVPDATAPPEGTTATFHSSCNLFSATSGVPQEAVPQQAALQQLQAEHEQKQHVWEQEEEEQHQRENECQYLYQSSVPESFADGDEGRLESESCGSKNFVADEEQDWPDYGTLPSSNPTH
eukprot:g5274.t1